MSRRSRPRTQHSISAPSFPPVPASRLPSTPSQHPGQIFCPSSIINLHPRTSAESVPQSAPSADSYTRNLHTLPTSNILLLPTLRPGRKQWSTPLDPNPNTSYGDNIREKPTNSLRIFFQNVKGLSHSDGFEDYKYYLSSLHAFGVDISGLAETNWKKAPPSRAVLRSTFAVLWTSLHFASQMRFKFNSKVVAFCDEFCRCEGRSGISADEADGFCAAKEFCLS
jgi:hypothetical protein